MEEEKKKKNWGPHEYTIFKDKDGKPYIIKCKKCYKVLEGYVKKKRKSDASYNMSRLYKEIAEKEYKLITEEDIEYASDSNEVKYFIKRVQGNVTFRTEYKSHRYIDAIMEVTGIKFSDLCEPYFTLDQMSYESKYPLNSGEDTNDYSDLIGFINMDNRKKLRDEIRTEMKEDNKEDNKER